MAAAPTKTQVNESTALAQLLQQMLDSRASAKDLIDTALKAGVTLDPDLTKRMVDYVASGQKGASFLPGVLSEEPTAALPEEPANPYVESLYAGVGDVAAGVGDIAGIVGNPLNALINAAFGTNLSTDLGGTLREATAAPEGDPLASAINRAAAGSLVSAGGAGLLRNMPGMAGLFATEMAAQPIAQTVSGAGAGGAAELARQEGAGFVGQTGAALVGALLGQKAAGAVAPRLATEVPTLPRIAEVAAPVTPPPTPRVPRVPAVEALPEAPLPAAAPELPEMPTPTGPKAPIAEPTPVAPTTAKVEAAPPISIPEPVRITPEQRAIDAAALDATPPEQLQVILEPTRQREILSYQGDYAKALAEMGIRRPKNMPLTEFIQSHMLADTVPDNVRIGLMQKHNIRSAEDQFRAAGISRESLSRSARDLNAASQLERQLQRLFVENPELLDEFEVAKAVTRDMTSSYMRLMGIESGLLTTQIGTLVRNALGATGIMPAYAAMTEVIDAGLRSAKNQGRAPGEMFSGPSAVDALYGFWDQFGGTLGTLGRELSGAAVELPYDAINRARRSMGLPAIKAPDVRSKLKTKRAEYRDDFMEAFRAALPNKYNKLFGRYSSDQVVPQGDNTSFLGKKLSAVERAVDFMNVGNRFMDRTVKNAQFVSILEMEAKRSGIDIKKLFDEGRLNELAKGDVVDKAVRLMQKRSFEDRPEGPEKYNELARSLINLMNYVTRPLGLSPYPNFFVSFFKHIFEQNPLAIVRFASKAEQKKLAKGDYRAIGQIGAGLATTLAYFAMKDPDDGTQWYEYKIDGTPVDMSAAMAPHLPSMLQAHLLHLGLQDRMNEFDWGRDLARVIGSSNLRAGVGQYAIDQGINEAIRAAQTGDYEGAKRIAEKWVQERISGWPVFFRNFRDTIQLESDAVSRDPQTVAQEFATNFPGGAAFYKYWTGEEIPLRYTPTRAEPSKSPDPLLRQLTGAYVREPRNKLEEFVVDLGMVNSDLYKKSGLSETYDRLMVQEIGRLVETRIEDEDSLLSRITQKAGKLKSLNPEEQRQRIREEYTYLRKIARNNLAERLPVYVSARYYDGLSADERIAQDRKDRSNPERGRTFPEFFREVEEAGIRPTAYSVEGREDIPTGVRYADLPTYSIRVKQ